MAYSIDFNGVFYISAFCRKWRRRASLVTFLLMAGSIGCSGGGGSGSASPAQSMSPGVSGQLCVTSNTSYTVTDGATNQTQKKSVDTDPLLQTFVGNSGGQIRAVVGMSTLDAKANPISTLIWGGGSAIRYGSPGKLQGMVPLQHRGTVTSIDIADTDTGKQLVFGTEQGFGLATLGSDGKPTEVSGAYRALASGVVAVAAGSGDTKGSLFFVTGDGYLLKTSIKDLSSAVGCSDILTATPALMEKETAYRAIDVALSGKRAIVLASRRSTTNNLAPDFVEAFTPLFQSMLEAKAASIVRGVDIASHGILNMGYDALDGSFKAYDRFVPTSIAVDGTAVYVAGFVYDQKTIDSFLAAKCTQTDLTARITCLAGYANDGTLFQLTTPDGLSALGGGFFIYRNPQDLSKPAHFEWIPLTIAQHQPGAASLTFKLAVQQDHVFLRAPNFLVSMSKSAAAGAMGEQWDIQGSYDTTTGLTAAIPAHLNIFSTSAGMGVATAAVSTRRGDGTGLSTLEIFNADKSFVVADTGATFTKAIGATSAFVAALDVANGGSGMLSLQGQAIRRQLSITATSAPTIVAAAMNDYHLGFAWSEAPTAGRPRPPWHIAAQSVNDDTTRGDLIVSREGGNGHYDGFPQLTGLSSDDVLRSRSIADMTIDGNHLFVLYEGIVAGTWYHQVGVYWFDTDYQPKLVGLTNTISSTMTAGYVGGHFVRVTGAGGSYVILFSAPDGLYHVTMITGDAGHPTKAKISQVTALTGLVDVACDSALGTVCTYVEGYNVHLFDLANPRQDLGSISIPHIDSSNPPSLYGASVAVSGSKLFVATPYDPQAGLYRIDASTPSAMKIVGECALCRFDAVKIFAQTPTLLHTSSPAGGVEVYDFSGL